jgi:hypothetical protein
MRTHPHVKVLRLSDVNLLVIQIHDGVNYAVLIARNAWPRGVAGGSVNRVLVTLLREKPPPASQTRAHTTSIAISTYFSVCNM